MVSNALPNRGPDDEESPEFEVWPENTDSLQLFLAMTTQWRWSGGMASQRVGFDYNAISIVREGLELKADVFPRCFSDLRAMEGAVLGEFNKAAS